MKGASQTQFGPLVKRVVLTMAVGLLALFIAAGPVQARKLKNKQPASAKTTELTPEKLARLDNPRPAVVYESLGRLDPFRPFFDLTQIERTIPTDPGRPQTPLEKFALNQYRLVGIMLAGGDHNYALVEDPERVGHSVRIGELIGNQSGRVKAIKENEVVIEEPYLDIFDQRQLRTITLQLHALDKQNLSPLLDNQDALPPADPARKASSIAPASGEPEKKSVN